MFARSILICLLLSCLYSVTARAFQPAIQSTFHHRYSTLKNIQVDADWLEQHVTTGNFQALFTFYQQIVTEKQHLSQLSCRQCPLHASDSLHHLRAQLQATAQQLTKQVAQFMQAHQRTILATEENFQPQGLIVLGTTPGLGTLESRLNETVQLAQKYPHIPIILSGKGLDAGQIEADYMYAYLIRRQVASERLIKESAALDTVGNAVFSYMKIVDKQPKIKDWLIVTNQFHAMRAWFNFTHVFPASYHIAVYLAPLLPKQDSQALALDKRVQALIKSELNNHANAAFLALLSYPYYDEAEHKFVAQEISGHPCAILNEMLLKHAAYTPNSSQYMQQFPKCF